MFVVLSHNMSKQTKNVKIKAEFDLEIPNTLKINDLARDIELFLQSRGVSYHLLNTAILNIAAFKRSKKF